MAQKVIIELVDDLDGRASDDINTVRFALDGASYEIDLSEHNANRLRNAVADYIAVARRTGGRITRGATPATSPTRPSANREQTRAIRDWARRNGFDLADRGRIPANILDAFDQAHTTATATKPKRKSRSTTKAATR
jgi:hypothetical protein